MAKMQYPAIFSDIINLHSEGNDLRKNGKLAKLLGVPVVTLLCHGHHVNSPFWNLHDRGVKPTEAEFAQIFSAEELKSATPDEVNEKIRASFVYDDFAWQKERGIRVTKMALATEELYFFSKKSRKKG